MYHTITVEGLSENQIRKLLRGEPIRVRKHDGTGHVLQLSEEQKKKLERAHKKKTRSTILFDPYQRDNHQHLQGTGFLSKAFKHVKKHAIHHGKQFLKEQARHHLPAAQDYIHKQITKHAPAASHDFLHNKAMDLGNQAQDHLDGQGIGRFFKGVKKVAKSAGHALKPIGKEILHYGVPILKNAAEGALTQAMTGAMMGGGKRGRGRPRKRITAGSLMPAGY